jgi:hypothetical protein
MPTAGSEGVAFSYKQGTPVPDRQKNSGYEADMWNTGLSSGKDTRMKVTTQTPTGKREQF